MGILRPALSDKLEHLRSLEIEVCGCLTCCRVQSRRALTSAWTAQNLIPQPESTESNSPAMLDQGDDMLGRTASTETCRTHRSTHPGSTVAHRRETPYMEDYNAEPDLTERKQLHHPLLTGDLEETLEPCRWGWVPRKAKICMKPSCFASDPPNPCFPCPSLTPPLLCLQMRPSLHIHLIDPPLPSPCSTCNAPSESLLTLQGKELGGVSKFRQEHSSLSAPQERASSQVSRLHSTDGNHRNAHQFCCASSAEVFHHSPYPLYVVSATASQ
eukprot:2665492-Rhodomonas_salina.2